MINIGIYLIISMPKFPASKTNFYWYKKSLSIRMANFKNISPSDLHKIWIILWFLRYDPALLETVITFASFEILRIRYPDLLAVGAP